MIVSDIAYHFIPFLFLFYTAVEILLRDPRNRLHRVTMGFIISFSLLFLGDFFMQSLPPEDAVLGLRLKLTGAFLTMTFGFYFFRALSKSASRPAWQHIAALIPLAGILPLFIDMPPFHYELLSGPYFRMDNYNRTYKTLIYAVAALSMLGFLSQAVLTVARLRSKGLSKLEQKRIRLILRGSLISCAWVVISVLLIKPIFQHAPLVPASTVVSSAVLLFAFFIRHAMVNYDFLSTAAKRYEILFNLSSNGIFLLDHHGKLVEMNPAGQKMMGFAPGDSSWKGMLLADMVTLIDEEQHEVFKHSIEHQVPMQLESRIRNRLGQEFTVESKMYYMEVEGRYWIYLTNQDITLQKENERMLKELAYRDSLTGLLNRRSFMDILTETAERHASAGRGGFAVFIIDLDHFKSVNDTYGHAAGDELLKVVAERLKAAVPDRSHVARMGGDEFVILLEGVSRHRDVQDAADRLAEQLNKPVRLINTDYEVTASIGVWMAGEEAAELETILRDADSAMYAAKQAGRNRYRIFGGADLSGD